MASHATRRRIAGTTGKEMVCNPASAEARPSGLLSFPLLLIVLKCGENALDFGFFMID